MLQFFKYHKKKLLVILAIILVITLTNQIWPIFSPQEIHPLSESWEKVIPHQEIPEGLASISAAHCGSCHRQHYEEWKLSTHAHAWTDLQFQAELNKESSPFICINCHIPLQNQQEYIVEGLVDGDIYKPVKRKNPHFDPNLQQEGITCASCHIRNNTIIGPTGRVQKPHKTVADTDFLSEKLCISCHNASAILTPALVCTFETGNEWKSGPYFEKENCISCHMEVVEREIVPGYGKRQSRYHYFPGSGIPKLASVDARGLNGLGIYPSQPDSTCYLGDSIGISLKVINEFAGHNVPTGDPERFINISFTLSNESDSVLMRKTEKIGEEWQWHPTVQKLADNNLKPGEERNFSLSYLTTQTGQLTWTVNITKHRLDAESAAYNKLTNAYPLFITVFEEQYVINVQ